MNREQLTSKKFRQSNKVGTLQNILLYVHSNLIKGNKNYKVYKKKKSPKSLHHHSEKMKKKNFNKGF